MSKAMKKAKILSSESDASIKVKQTQDTDIDLHIKPPSQTVNFQPCAMADLATMAPPTQTLKPSTFNPILEEEPLIRSVWPSQEYLTSSLMHPALRVKQAHASTQMDGSSVQISPQETPKQSLSQEEPLNDIVKERSIKKEDYSDIPKLIDRSLASSALPTLRHPETHMETIKPVAEKIPDTVTETQITIPDISIIDELKRPEEMLPNQPSIKQAQEQERERYRLQEILNEKTKRANILESMLEIYENKHQMVNGMLTCKQKQLEHLIKSYCGAEQIELMFEPVNCGCGASSPKLIDIESILVTLNGRTVDFRYGFNDAYADMVRHGINLKQIIA